MSENPLARLDQATRLLAEARTVDDVKLIRDQAEAMRVYARERDLGLEAQNHAAEIKIRAERRLGELDAQLPKNEGTKAQLQGKASGGPIVRPPEDNTPTYADLGLTKQEMQRFRQMAAISEPVFEQHVAETKAAEQEITTAGVVRLAAEEKRKHDQEIAGQIFAVAQSASPDAEANQRARHLQTSFAKALAKSQDLVCLKPEALAAVLSVGDVDQGRRFIRRFDEWADAFEAATAQPIRALTPTDEEDAV